MFVFVAYFVFFGLVYNEQDLKSDVAAYFQLMWGVFFFRALSSLNICHIEQGKNITIILSAWLEGLDGSHLEL